MTDPTSAPPESAPHPGAATDAELTRLVRRLSRGGHSVEVIRLVERWSEEADLPRDGRLAAARAFIDLKLMDRAWVHLRELTEQDAADLEAQVLTAEMFIARGWGDRAKRPIERIAAIEPEHPRLESLRDAVGTPAPEAPADVRERIRRGDAEELLELAEIYLRAGSILRAQGILERLKRGAGKDNLGWPTPLGVRGDLTLASTSWTCPGSCGRCCGSRGRSPSRPAPPCLRGRSPSSRTGTPWTGPSRVWTPRPRRSARRPCRARPSRVGRRRPSQRSSEAARTQRAPRVRMRRDCRVRHGGRGGHADPPTAENTDESRLRFRRGGRRHPDHADHPRGSPAGAGRGGRHREGPGRSAGAALRPADAADGEPLASGPERDDDERSPPASSRRRTRTSWS